MWRDSPNAIQEAPQARGFFVARECCGSKTRVAPFAVMPSMHGKSRASLVMLNMHSMSRATLRHAEFEERGIQLFLVTQSNEFAESAESRKFARVARGSVARREATHKAGAATEFLSFPGRKVDIVVRSCNNAMMEHRIDVQRDCCKDRDHSHGDKHFQESKAVSKSFRQS